MKLNKTLRKKAQLNGINTVATTIIGIVFVQRRHPQYDAKSQQQTIQERTVVYFKITE